MVVFSTDSLVSSDTLGIGVLFEIGEALMISFLGTSALDSGLILPNFVASFLEAARPYFPFLPRMNQYPLPIKAKGSQT